VRKKLKKFVVRNADRVPYFLMWLIFKLFRLKNIRTGAKKTTVGYSKRVF